MIHAICLYVVQVFLADGRTGSKVVQEVLVDLKMFQKYFSQKRWKNTTWKFFSPTSATKWKLFAGLPSVGGWCPSKAMWKTNIFPDDYFFYQLTNFGHRGKMNAGSIFQFNTPAAAVKMWLNGYILNKNNFRNISAGWQNCWPLTWISVSNYLLIPWCRGTVNHQHPPSTQSLNKLPWASKFEAKYLKFSRFWLVDCAGN